MFKLRDNMKTLVKTLPQDKGLILILLLGAMAFILEEFIPAHYIMVYIFMNIALFMYGEKGRIHRIMAIIVGAITYGVYITTHYVAILHVIYCGLGLSFLYNIVNYFTNKELYVPQIVNAFRQLLIAFTYGILVYGIIYLITFFINNIFSLNLFGNNYLFRVSTGLAWFVYWMVAFSMPAPKETVGGPFFTALFGKLIPKLSLLAGVLAIIYMFQMLIGVRPDMAFMWSYYPYVALFYIAFVLSFHTGKVTREHWWILSIFIVLTCIAIAFIIKRQWTVPSQQYSAIYPLMINLLFLAFNIYLLRIRVGITALLSKLVLALAIVVFTPIVGAIGYWKIATYTGDTPETWVPHYNIGEFMAKRNERSELDDFNRFGKPFAFVKAPFKGGESEETALPITYHYIANEAGGFEITGAKHMYAKTHVTGRGDSVNQGRFQVKLSQDYKAIQVYENEILIVTAPVFDAVAKMQKEAPLSDKKPLVFENQQVIVIVSAYDYDETTPSNTYARATYYLIVK